MSTSNAPPCSTDPYQFKHTCLLECQPDEHAEVIAANEEGLAPSSKSKECIAVPYVASDYFYINDVAKKFATIIKEVSSFG